MFMNIAECSVYSLVHFHFISFSDFIIFILHHSLHTWTYYNTFLLLVLVTEFDSDSSQKVD